MKTPKYFSKRTSPTTGAVMERQPDGTAVQVTPELPYSECMAFVRENRDEMLTLFKVARLAPRRDAARRFVRKILARDLSEAVQIFRDFVGDEDPARFQLLTGDWQLICEKVPTVPSNFSNIINLKEKIKMAREKKTENKESSFKEFSFKGKEITFSGRIYPDLKKSGDKVDITPMNLTINGVISIKGCRLMQSDKNTWIAFPQYKDSKGNYQSYVYVDKAYSEAELDKVAQAAEEAVK